MGKQISEIDSITIPTPYAVGDVQAYIIKGDCLTLVDAGVKTDEAWKALTTQLKALGYIPEDIEQIVLTHHHPDHMGLVEYFPRLDQVLGHPKLKPWLERDETYLSWYETFFASMYEESGVPEQYNSLLQLLRKPMELASKGKLTGFLLEGNKIPGHEEWVTVETPGHAQDHLSFYREKDGALIAGDHLLEHISPNPLLEPSHQVNGERPRPLLQYRESLSKLSSLDLGVVYPGHGNRFEQAHVLIQSRIKKQEERAEKVVEWLDYPHTAYQVCQKLFRKHIKTQFGLTMSETIGQLDYLEDIGRLDVFFNGTTKYYQANGGVVS